MTRHISTHITHIYEENFKNGRKYFCLNCALKPLAIEQEKSALEYADKPVEIVEEATTTVNEVIVEIETTVPQAGATAITNIGISNISINEKTNNVDREDTMPMIPPWAWGQWGNNWEMNPGMHPQVWGNQGKGRFNRN